jgi:hypothetical protein
MLKEARSVVGRCENMGMMRERGVPRPVAAPEPDEDFEEVFSSVVDAGAGPGQPVDRGTSQLDP